MKNENEISELNEILAEIEGLRVTELICLEERPERIIGQNGVLFLLRLLERSRDLLKDCIAAYEARRILSLYVLVRAHFETTSSLMYFFGKLAKFYNGEIDLREFEESLSRVMSGSKLKPEADFKYAVLDPVNVLTTIKHADDLLREVGSDIDMFKRAYDFISEIAHPNHLGLIYRTATSLETKKVVFLTDEEAHFRSAKGPLLKLLISADVFLSWYKKAFEMLEKNETMPTLIK